MIHLQKDENFNTMPMGSAMSANEPSSLDKLLTDDFSFGSDLPSQSDDFSVGDVDSSGSETMESFAKEVLKALEDDNIPPLPSNFQLYFERLLEKKSEAFKKSVIHALELEDNSEDDHRIDFEKRIKDSFKNTKNILRHVAVIYKNLGLLQSIIAKRMNDAKKAENSIVFQNVLALFEQELTKLNSITQKQVSQLKEFYQDSARIVNSIDSEMIFDSQFGIYNRRHLLTQIDKEVKIIDHFGHSSTVLLARIPDSKIRVISSEKMLLVVMRTISRLILKTSRRSDLIAHYGGGIFAVLLKHSDLLSSKKACERLSDLIQTTNVFIGESEIGLDIVIGIARILPERSAEDTLNLALNAMEAANLAQIPFAVCNEDKEK